MKRLIYLIVLLIAFSACENDFEYTFDKTPTERKAEACDNLAKILSDSEYGWKTTLIVCDAPIVGDYFHFKFDRNEGQNNGLITVNSAYGESQSEFEVCPEIGAMLNFTTPNETFFWLVDPSSNHPKGYGADLEYIFMKEENGKLFFRGKKTENELVLEKAEEGDSDFTEIRAMYDNYTSANTKNYLFLCITGGLEGASEENPFYAQIEDSFYAMYFDEEFKKRFYNFKYIYEGERTRSMTCTYIFTPEGILLSDPLVLGQDTVKSFKYDKDLDQWQIDEGTVTGKVVASDLPFVPTPGIADLLVDNFLVNDDYCLMIDQWGCKGPLSDTLKAHYENTEAPTLRRIFVKNNYVSPDGQQLGAGVFFGQSDDSEYAFLPINIIKEGENIIRFERSGEDVVTNIDGAADKIANDTNINGFLDILFNAKGWMIGCDVIDYGTVKYYDCMLFNLEDPDNQIEYMGTVYN
jgi:hypothetical protein